MSKKYISQVNNHNFIYPNNTVAEYDVDIIHDINDNSVSGTTSNLVISGATATGITVSFNWTWSKNNAEPYISPVTGNIMLLSVHMTAPSDSYFNTWRMVENVSNATTGNTTYSGTTTFSLTPSQYNPATTAFTNGVYNFEIRMIGHRAVFPICSSFTVSTITPPTPTPTRTPVPASPTPTPTPSATPGASSIYTSGATINVTDTGWIKYRTATGDTYQQITTFGNVVLTNCLICSSIAPGIPFADVATFTIVNCGSNCSAPPVPTPSVTPSTAAPVYYRITDCQSYINYYSQSFPVGTFNSGDRVMGNVGYYYVVSGSYSSPPAGMEQRFVSATGLFGCP